MRPSLGSNAGPKMFSHADSYSRDLSVIGQKMRYEPRAKVLDLSHRLLSGKCVHSVFHRVGRKNLTVVASSVYRVKVTLELNVNRDVLDLVLRTVPGHAQQAHARFSVVIRDQLEAHRSAASISGVTV